MKKHLLRLSVLVLLCLALAAFVACSSGPSSGMALKSAPHTFPVQTYTTVQDGGAIVPTSSSDGLSLYGLDSYRLTVCAIGGNLNGAGAVLDYIRPVSAAQWSSNPGLTQTITVSGSPCQTWPDLLVGVPSGQFRPVVSGAGNSAGAGTFFTVYVDYLQE